jgi:hypothetical protein
MDEMQPVNVPNRLSAVPAVMPPVIVAWAGNWRIEVLSSRTGG